MGIPSFNRISIKSISKTEFLTITPAKAIIPMNEVAVKKAPRSQCPKTIPMSESGMATIITIGVLKFWNQPTISIYIMMITTANAVPKSLNTSKVICHSPSHFTV